MSAEKLRKYIIRQLAGDFRLSEDQTSIRLEIKALTPNIRRNIFSEGHLWGLSDDLIEYTINQVNNTIADCYVPRTRTLNYLNPVNVKPGLEIMLIGSNSDLGIAELDLLSMGGGRFFVLKCDRKGLVPGEIIRVADNRKWGVDHCAFFKVNRSKTSGIALNMVYRTFTLIEIRQKEPSEIIEIADSVRHFTYNEHRIEEISGNIKIPIAKNSMSLLLDNNSGINIINLLFEKNGNISFTSDKNVLYPPSPIRNALFKFDSVLTQEKTVNLETFIPGKLRLDTNGNLLIEQQAEAIVS